MQLMTIFSDESGYTGPNLTNKDQPYFVLATLSFEEHEAKAIRDYYFSGVQAQELKHASLARYSKQHSMVLEYLKHLQSCQDHFKMYAVDKEFAIVAKIVDYLVESAFHRMGHDIYSNGYAFALANMLYYALEVNKNPTYRDELLRRFEDMMRNGARIQYDAFFDYINRQSLLSSTRRSLKHCTCFAFVLWLQKMYSGSVHRLSTYPSLPPSV